MKVTQKILTKPPVLLFPLTFSIVSKNTIEMNITLVRLFQLRITIFQVAVIFQETNQALMLPTNPVEKGNVMYAGNCSNSFKLLK